MKKIKETDGFFKLEHRHDYSITSLECARVNKSIIYVTTHVRKAPIHMLSRRKTPKTQQVECFTHTRITGEILVTRMVHLLS